MYSLKTCIIYSQEHHSWQPERRTICYPLPTSSEWISGLISTIVELSRARQWDHTNHYNTTAAIQVKLRNILSQMRTYPIIPFTCNSKQATWSQESDCFWGANNYKQTPFLAVHRGQGWVWSHHFELHPAVLHGLLHLLMYVKHQ